MIDLYAFTERLYPMRRSLTGSGVRETLDAVGGIVPVERRRVPSGSGVYDWTVPPEWSVTAAYLDGPDGRVCDWDDHPLHVIGYSRSVDATWDDLDGHVFVGDGVIPYVTSYYYDRAGFCVATSPPSGTYHAYIDTTHDEHGHLDYADLVVPGESPAEVMFSTYVCHPAMCVDNTAAIAIQTALAEWVLSQPRKLTYRFVWVPETIGALCYMADDEPKGVERLRHLQERVIACFALSCLGAKSYGTVTHSRGGDTLADRVSHAVPHILRQQSWMQRGSDERQYGSPLAGLPTVGLASTRWGLFDEYHTSADTMDLVSPESLTASLDMLKRIVHILEGNGHFRARWPGDVQLGDRGLYPTLGHGKRDKRYQHVLSYCDGELDALAIAERTGLDPEWVCGALRTLEGHELVELL